MSVELTSGAPIVLGANIMPVMGGSFTPGVASELVRHSGLPFASGVVVPAVAPVLEFQTFYASAITALSGFKLVRFTALEFFLRGYTNAVASGTGDKWSLKTGGQAMAHISDVSEGAGGLIMATIQVFCLSGGALSGTEDIFERAAGATIPTVAAEPNYYIRGPISIGGAVAPGVTSFSFSPGNRVIPVVPTDGKTYAESVIYDGGDRSVSIGSDGIRALLQTLTARGVEINATSCIVYMRLMSRRGVVTGGAGNGASLSIAKGRIDPDSVAFSVGSQNTGSMTVRAINEALDQTDPVAHSMSATVP